VALTESVLHASLPLSLRRYQARRGDSAWHCGHMFMLGRPDLATLQQVLTEQESAPVTYEEIGATRSVMPAGYRHDRYEIAIGHGPDAFQRAVDGLVQWEAHRGAGLTLCPPLPKLQEGATVVLAVGLAVVSAVAACRIVYVLDTPETFGFAYGTLPAHPEQGEEAFTIHRQPEGVVTFAVTAFSRPRHPLARLGGPLTRRIQLQTTRRYLDALRAFGAR